MRLRFRRSVRSLRRIDRAVIKGTAPIGSAVIAGPPWATESIRHPPRLTPSGPPASEPASSEAAQRNIHGPLHEASGGSRNRRSDEPGMTRDPCHLSVDAETPPKGGPCGCEPVGHDPAEVPPVRVCRVTTRRPPCRPLLSPRRLRAARPDSTRDPSRARDQREGAGRSGRYRRHESPSGSVWGWPAALQPSAPIISPPPPAPLPSAPARPVCTHPAVPLPSTRRPRV